MRTVPLGGLRILRQEWIRDGRPTGRPMRGRSRGDTLVQVSWALVHPSKWRWTERYLGERAWEYLGRARFVRDYENGRFTRFMILRWTKLCSRRVLGQCCLFGLRYTVTSLLQGKLDRSERFLRVRAKASFVHAPLRVNRWFSGVLERTR